MVEKIGVQTLLRNVSGELERLAQIADRLDERIGDLVEDPSSVTRQGAADFQDVDALQQALVAMSLITRSAANKVSDDENALLDTSALAAGVTLERSKNACLQTNCSRPFEADRDHSDVATALFDEF